MAWDDVSGKELDAKKVNTARKKEIEGKKVWRKVSRLEAMRKGWSVLQVRWNAINKQDEDK